MKKLLTIIFALLMGLYMGCSSDGSSPSTNENLVTKTWYSYNNGNWNGSHSGAKWAFVFADCEESSNTEFYDIIHETILYFYTVMPSTGTERYQTAELARANCSNWNYNQITESYKNNITTLNNGTTFYRQKIKKSKYASIY